MGAIRKKFPNGGDEYKTGDRSDPDLHRVSSGASKMHFYSNDPSLPYVLAGAEG